MSNNITPVENLDPRQLAYIRKLWRRHEAGTVDLAFKRVVTIAGAIAVAAVCLSSVAAGSGWSPLATWMLGFVLGTFYTAWWANLAGWRLWPANNAVIDWKRVEEIATGNEKLNPTT